MGNDKQSVRLREDVYELQVAYDNATEDSDKEDKRKQLVMQKVLWAFYKIQRLDPKDPNSFFRIAGYHGMPFRGAGWGHPSWWGGYCNHGNVLFPTWHRAYMVRIENALRSVEGCEDVSLPYWNETSSITRGYGIPSIFLRQTVKIPRSVAKGSPEDLEIPNPLRSYTFQDGIWDNLAPVPDANYSKPKGYETKRYPFSGLVSSGDVGATAQHNKLINLIPDTDKLLNDNVKNWLGNSIIISTGETVKTNTLYKYKRCLMAPSYTVFSNNTSATQYNEDIYYNTKGNDIDSDSVPARPPKLPVVSLESPHNDMHLAIGGFSIPGQGNFDPIIGANGDMGENDTASFDPIFFFHHCFVDKVFWDWQRKWDPTLKSRTQLTINPEYPGTNSVDYQGPTPGVAGNTWLTMESPLAPFTKNDKPGGDPLTSNDVVDIVSQLGYKYYDCDDKSHNDRARCHERCGCGIGTRSGHSFDDLDDISWIRSQARATTKEPHGWFAHHAAGTHDEPPEEPSVEVVRVAGVNRAALSGSFALVVRAEVDGQDTIVGTESVLSRWKVSGCANCQNHLGVKAFVPLVGLDDKALSTVRVGLQGRGTRVENLNAGNGIKGGWRLGKMDMMHGMGVPTRARED
ncbi:tyrosinase [Daldinia grandis]|nr:tyrosinase [Daldinia grandis]